MTKPAALHTPKNTANPDRSRRDPDQASPSRPAETPWTLSRTRAECSSKNHARCC